MSVETAVGRFAPALSPGFRSRRRFHVSHGDERGGLPSGEFSRRPHAFAVAFDAPVGEVRPQLEARLETFLRLWERGSAATEASSCSVLQGDPSNAFSKKVENHFFALAIYFMHCNYVRIHQTLRVTPAMAAGVSKTLWTLDGGVAMIERGEECYEKANCLSFKRVEHGSDTGCTARAQMDG